MSVVATRVIPILDKTPGKRCSDYDEDCVLVPSLYHCWLGDLSELGQADGYCPLLLGME